MYHHKEEAFRTIAKSTIAWKKEAADSGPINRNVRIISIATSKAVEYRNCGCGVFIELYLPLQSPKTHNIDIPKISQT